MKFNNIFKTFFLIFILINELNINEYNKLSLAFNLNELNRNQTFSFKNTSKNFTKFYLKIENIDYSFSKLYGMIEVIYYINIYDKNYNKLKPFLLASLYGISCLCNIYISKTNENIYSFANIYKNKYFFCVEYIKIDEKVYFGIKLFKINLISEEYEYYQKFFFTEKIFNIDKNPSLENNNKFDMNYIYNNYNKLLYKINNFKEFKYNSRETYNLKISFLQAPLFNLKRDIANVEGKWHFHNIYSSYFCFCKGDECISLISFNSYNFQPCKYYFYLTIIDNNKNLYSKTDYLLSDFFDENIESSDALPIFLEMRYKKFKVHYLTMSYNIYQNLCLINEKCINEAQIIYGIKKINGDILEKFIDLFLRIKIVIAAEKFSCIDNLFYNINYITYIFLGHGVTYIKSYLYQNYLSPKTYNKILLPPSKEFINLGIEAGWKYENIIKIGYPKWDGYEIFKNDLIHENIKEKNRSIFLMFTWRKLKIGKNVSYFYLNNLQNLLNNRKLNRHLKNNNITLFYSFHHSLKGRKKLSINSNNIRNIEQNKISLLLKNCSLIITDFSSILFDAIVQRKPLILYIPDALDPNLEDIYSKEYCETINKLKNGTINLYEVFIHLNSAVNKIIYYINNDFLLENEKLKFYKKFNLKNRGNTKKFIKYVTKL